jgi:hypothetical protein
MQVSDQRTRPSTEQEKKSKIKELDEQKTLTLIVKKQAMISLLILSVIASGSVFSVLSDFYGISISESKALSSN